MKVRFLKPAQSEIDDAFAWYESQSQGLGTQFLDEFDRAFRRIMAYPLANAEIGDGLRRCLLSRFPYGMLGIRFSQDKLSYYDKILSIPLYMVEQLPRLAEGLLR